MKICSLVLKLFVEINPLDATDILKVSKPLFMCVFVKNYGLINDHTHFKFVGYNVTSLTVITYISNIHVYQISDAWYKYEHHYCLSNT